MAKKTKEVSRILFLEIRDFISNYFESFDPNDDINLPTTFLEGMKELIEQDFDEIGRCDHSVGICRCKDESTLKDICEILGTESKYLPKKDPYDVCPCCEGETYAVEGGCNLCGNGIRNDKGY